MSDSAKEVARILLERRQVGIRKYGKLVDPADLTENWTLHGFEEACDLAVYLWAARHREAALREQVREVREMFFGTWLSNHQSAMSLGGEHC